MKVLDLLFPKKCVVCKKTGDYICENCFINLSFDAKSVCLLCDKASYNNLTHPACFKKYSIDGCFSALTYNKTTQKLVYSFKYKPYLTDLSIFLSELFYDSLIQNEDFVKETKKVEWVFVPVPLYSLKLRQRGYNQAEILAKVLSKKFNFKTQDILKRVRDTKTQVGFSNLKRAENIKHAFSMKPNFDIKNKNIFLVDDVVTTGSTLKEAAKVFKQAGAKRVIGLTLARD